MPTNTSVTQVGPDETPVSVSLGGNVYNSESFDKVVPCIRRAIHNGSGGQQLEDAAVGKIVIRNGSGNGPMFIGGIGNLAPFSGRGLTLYANETFTAPVKNMNAVSVMATVSGEYIECIGFLSGPDPTMDVSGIFIPPDETAPVISGVVPISGISGAEINSEISVLFSECMNPLTVTTTEWTVRISGSSTDVSGIVSQDSLNCALFYFSPYSGNMSGAQMYVSRIAGGASGVRDIAGNAMVVSGRWHWTTVSGIPPDITLPTVSGTTPGSGTVNVSINIAPIVQFSEQMQSGTVTNSTVRLKLSGTNLPTTVVLDPDLRTATMTPDDPLGYNKAYEIAFTESALLDLAGNAMSGDLARSFFTEDGPWNQVFTASRGADTNMPSPYRVGHRIMAGTSPSFVNEQFVKVRVELSQFSTQISGGRASGLVVQLRKASDSSVIHFTRPFTAFMDPKVDLSGISTPQPFDFYNSDNTYPTQAGDIIEIQYLSGSSAIEAGYGGNTSTAVIWTQYAGGSYSGAVYSNISSRDLAGILWAR
jgi:hypothetical protein